MNNKIWTILALVVGFFIGKNWDKIRKIVKPYAETVAQKTVSGAEGAKKFLEEQKAKVIAPKKRKGRPAAAKTA